VKRTKASLTPLLILLIVFSMMQLPSGKTSSESVTWSEEKQLTFDPVDDEWNITLDDIDELPSIAATRDNKIWVVWRTNVIMGNYEIYYKIYNPLFGNWTEDKRLTSNSAVDTNPAIIQTSDNKIWVFWTSLRTGNYELFYKTTINEGVSWSSETQLTNDTRYDASPALIQASDGKIWLVWMRRTDSTIQDIYYRTYNGTSWSTENQLTTSPDRDGTPSVTQAQDGKIWVFWSRFIPAEHEHIFAKSYDGSTWSVETQLTLDGKENLDPSAFVENDGTIWVFWQSRNQNPPTDPHDLFYKTSSNNGVSWSESVRFTTYNDDDFLVSATQAPDASIWVVWTSYRKDEPYGTVKQYDLYYRTSLTHNVAISKVIASPAAVFPSWIVAVNVTAKNTGDYDETFTVTSYAGSDLIGSQSVTVTPKASITANFTWNTASYSNGNYVITAEISTVPNEHYTGDNFHNDGTIYVKLIGDTNSDNRVNHTDLFNLGKSFGSNNPDCDFDRNGTVDTSDLSGLNQNYGQ